MCCSGSRGDNLYGGFTSTLNPGKRLSQNEVSFSEPINFPERTLASILSCYDPLEVTSLKGFTEKDFWRAVILYGLNTATYKMAFAKSLDHFVSLGKSDVPRRELAEVFFNLYLDRLKNGMPQLDQPGRTTVMEKVVARYNLGTISLEDAVDYVERNAFNDVLRAFPKLNREQIPVDFYRYDDKTLYLTESVHRLLTSPEREALMSEVDSRWGLIEAAFQMKREVDASLESDIRALYLLSGYERTDITDTIPVLNGYQKGTCFYCAESMLGHDIHVDHVIPRQLIYHDEIWNLVLAHGFCNQQKSDALPSRKYIEKLILRNEHFIASNHPIRGKLIATMGSTQKARKQFVERIYSHAQMVIPYTWEGIRGYNPDTDEFYRSIIRGLSK